jgi:hypothetical protein
MYDNFPLGVYIRDCSKSIDFTELKAKGVKFVVARLGDGKGINLAYSVANNKRYLDLGFDKVVTECHKHGMFCIPEWHFMTGGNDYPRDFPNPANDKQIVPLVYGLQSKTFQAVSVRITDVLDSSTRIADAVSMFYGYIKKFYGKKATFLTINRNMFEKGSPALGDTISQAGKEWPLFIVDNLAPGHAFTSWSSFKLPPTTPIITPGNFNAGRGGLIWQFGSMPNYGLCLWIGSEAHMLDKFGERPANYSTAPSTGDGSTNPGGDNTNPGGGTTNPGDTVIGGADLVAALNGNAEKIDKLADSVISLKDALLTIFNRK